MAALAILLLAGALFPASVASAPAPPVPPADGSHVPNPVQPHYLLVSGGQADVEAALTSAELRPGGLNPDLVKAAYSFSTLPDAGSGTTIAVVVPYDNPTAESDLAVFSAQFALAPCTTANGCFKKVNQTGGGDYPAANTAWAIEGALDVEWAHAIAPGARILLVEATTNEWNDLLPAIYYARAQAQYISISWGSPEFAEQKDFDAYFVAPGVSFFASAGDSGAAPEYPSTSPNVLSVGGTTLRGIGTQALSETGWSRSGGGCSLYELAHPAQARFDEYKGGRCAGKRSTPDLAFVADPATGVAIYTSQGLGGGGWRVVGGTSASTPIAAARAATTARVIDATRVYGSEMAFRDITSGSNGTPARLGLDTVTGRGSWIAAATTR
jgi:subtilase family serine protease